LLTSLFSPFTRWTKHGIVDLGATRLAEGLAINTALQVLDVSNNRITRDGVVAFARMTKWNSSLQSLNLSYNRLEDEGAETICSAVATNPCGLSRCGPI